MPDDRHPVVVGVGQVSVRNQAGSDIAGPLDLMADAAGLAGRDTGAAVLDAVDQLTVVHPFSWDYGNAPALLAERLGLSPSVERRYLGVGGHTPQRAVNELADRLASGEIETALLAGGEVLAGKLGARNAGQRVDWGRHPDPLPPVEARDPNHPVEHEHDAMLPIYSYPLWEPALRVSAGRTLDEQRAHIGMLMHRFTEVAAQNPVAWFREPAEAHDLMTVTEENRMISSPYPKRVNSIIRVDQGAALVLTTAGRARSLGIPEDRWVWIVGAGDGEDIWYLTERTGYSSSPSMARVAAQVWESSGYGVGEIDHFDLYSCFPSAVQLAMRAYGIDDDDPRPMTVTGGLPYAGGPGNNYTTHSIAAMVDRLRGEPGLGLCTGLGWHVTRHSAGLYSSRPPLQPYHRIDPEPDNAAVEAEPHPRIDDRPSGPATIEGYSVSYDREGDPEVARVLARLDPERRTMVSSRDSTVVRALTEGEGHGREIEVAPDLSFSI
jgi:acetyl-CoA C-acetyltransferase